jgi:N utilization substance protein B
MGRRTKARECAFQMLYQGEIGGEPIERVREGFWRLRATSPATREMADRLASGAWARREEIDALVGEAATRWRLERIATVERTILRLGTYELLAEAATPAAVVIDEAVEMAKRFGDAESAAFVNGVLDAVRRRVRAAPDGVPARRP